MIICINIIYLIEKGNGVEIKTSIIGDEFKIVNTIFVDDRIYNFGEEIMQPVVIGTEKHQRTVDDSSEGLRTSEGQLNLEKG